MGEGMGACVLRCMRGFRARCEGRAGDQLQCAPATHCALPAQEERARRRGRQKRMTGRAGLACLAVYTPQQTGGAAFGAVREQPMPVLGPGGEPGWRSKGLAEQDGGESVQTQGAAVRASGVRRCATQQMKTA